MPILRSVLDKRTRVPGDSRVQWVKEVSVSILMKVRLHVEHSTSSTSRNAFYREKSFSDCQTDPRRFRIFRAPIVIFRITKKERKRKKQGNKVPKIDNFYRIKAISGEEEDRFA